ncbi:MAG: hypothetical protein C0446_08445 [Chitinophaga sp.]|nr:hypothetical protein [Chitinophaga sp.]
MGRQVNSRRVDKGKEIMEDISLWKERRENLTASEMAGILGLNKYNTPTKILEQKISPAPVINNHVRRGKLREISVIEAFHMDAKMDVVRHVGRSISMSDGTKIAATPDAYIANTKDPVECKSIMSTNFHKWFDEIPIHYLIQVIVQNMVLDSNVGYIGALEEGDPVTCQYRFVAWKVYRVPEVENIIKQEATRFWNCVDKEVKFRVNHTLKEKILKLLEGSTELIYPPSDFIVVEKERDRDERLSKLISLFE